MGEFGEKSAACGTVCLKYLLFTFNCCFWLAGLAVMAVGIWTLALKSDYISLLASGTYLATAYILVVAGVVVMVTGALGCCATFKERRNLLRLYFGLLLIIFLLEIIAGVLAYVYYQQVRAGTGHPRTWTCRDTRAVSWTRACRRRTRTHRDTDTHALGHTHRQGTHVKTCHVRVHTRVG